MELSVGDKVRVYFYPPNTTRSFVEGIVDRNRINSFRGPSFSLQTTREVVLGHEIRTRRSLPYIIAYAKDNDFNGRIEVLEAAVQPRAEPKVEAEPAGGTDHVAPMKPELAEPRPALDTQVELEIQSEPEKRGWRRLFNRAA